MTNLVPDIYGTSAEMAPIRIIFQDLALHVMNFKGVVSRFNGQVAMQTFVFR